MTRAMWRGILGCVLLALASPTAQGDGAGPTLSAESYEIEVCGSFMLDWVAFLDEDQTREALMQEDAEAPDPFVGGTEFRRARLGVKGPLSAHLALKLEYDFSGGKASAKDVYLEIQDVPWLATVRLGHQYEPLNRLSGSSKHFLFLEKSLANAFSSGRNTGIRILTPALQRRLTFSAGAFRNTDGLGGAEEREGYNLAARLTGLPLCQSAGRRLLHLGAFYSRRNPEQSDVSFRQRPETHLGSYLVDTGKLTASKVDVLGFEAAAILGPASLQAEYMQAVVDLTDDDAVRLSGYYVTATWLLTGEHRAYSRKSGAFTKLKPAREFDPAQGGPGAWMLLIRHSHLDLEDGDVRGGCLTDLSFGLNWYLKSNVRMTWNYILVDADQLGELQIAQMRIQVQV